MSRTDKILRRRSNWLRWRKLHGYACVVCGIDLEDEDLVDGADPRQPRTCLEHCGQPVDLDAL